MSNPELPPGAAMDIASEVYKEGFAATAGHGAESPIAGEHLLTNGRRYRITDTGQPYTPGEYPSGGLSIYVWHPAIENWSYVSNAPSDVEARAFLASAERLADEGTQWMSLPSPAAVRQHLADVSFDHRPDLLALDSAESITRAMNASQPEGEPDAPEV